MELQIFWIILLATSVILNMICLWGFFHYIRYGGSPLGELKRRITGRFRQTGPGIPYAEENKEISEQIARGDTGSPKVVFIGASITGAWDIEKCLPKIHAIKRIGGYVPDLLLNFKRNVIDLQPEAVVIKFCSINIRAERPLLLTKNSMEMMVQLARANGITPIVTTMIPVGKPGAHIGDFSVIDTIRKFNDWLRNYVEQNSLPMIDYARALEDKDGFLPRELSSDPVHLNENGYEVISEAARPIIYEITGIKDS